MKVPKLDRNIAGHFFGLFISLIFVGMGLVGIWQEVNSIISIEDAFLPFPYWYIGNEKMAFGCRMMP